MHTLDTLHEKVHIYIYFFFYSSVRSEKRLVVIVVLEPPSSPRLSLEGAKRCISAMTAGCSHLVSLLKVAARSRSNENPTAAMKTSL